MFRSFYVFQKINLRLCRFLNLCLFYLIVRYNFFPDLILYIYFFDLIFHNLFSSYNLSYYPLIRFIFKFIFI